MINRREVCEIWAFDSNANMRYMNDGFPIVCDKLNDNNPFNASRNQNNTFGQIFQI